MENNASAEQPRVQGRLNLLSEESANGGAKRVLKYELIKGTTSILPNDIQKEYGLPNSAVLLIMLFGIEDYAKLRGVS